MYELSNVLYCNSQVMNETASGGVEGYRAVLCG